MKAKRLLKRLSRHLLPKRQRSLFPTPPPRPSRLVQPHPLAPGPPAAPREGDSVRAERRGSGGGGEGAKGNSNRGETAEAGSLLGGALSLALFLLLLHNSPLILTTLHLFSLGGHLLFFAVASARGQGHCFPEDRFSPGVEAREMKASAFYSEGSIKNVGVAVA